MNGHVYYGPEDEAINRLLLTSAGGPQWDVATMGTDNPEEERVASVRPLSWLDWDELIPLQEEGVDTVTPSTTSASQPDSSEEEGFSTQSAVNRVRRLSGLTWDQVGELFGVSRRSVHFWASGRPLSSENEKKLFQILDVLERKMTEGHGRATLLAKVEGTSAFDLLCEGKLEEAASLLESKPVPTGRTDSMSRLSEKAQEARRPPSPERLVGALDDPADTAPARRRVAVTRRRRREGDE